MALACLLGAVSVHADQKPLWEAGLGIGALSFPDYRGSDQSHLYPTPVPYFVYRGDILKSDRVNIHFQIDGENLSNVLNVIDFGGLFSGNAIGPSRSFYLRLKTDF